MKKTPCKPEKCCDMRGMLSFLILFLLSKKPMCGQELARALEERKGVHPSPGTIYPALKHLKDEGMIHEQGEGKIITYTLTREGKAVLETAKGKFIRAFKDVV